MNIKHTITTLSFLAVTITIVITAALLNTASAQTVQKRSESEALLLFPTVSISIDVDGTEKYYDVPVGSIDNALSYLNITLSDDDIVNADLSDTVYLGQKIKIDRVNYSYYPTHKEIPYTTVVQESSKLFVGQSKVYQQGKSGSTEYIYKDKYVNGELISHKCIKQQVLTYPTDKIIVKGNRNIDIINKSYNNISTFVVSAKSHPYKKAYECTKDELYSEVWNVYADLQLLNGHDHSKPLDDITAVIASRDKFYLKNYLEDYTPLNHGVSIANVANEFIEYMKKELEGVDTIDYGDDGKIYETYTDGSKYLWTYDAETDKFTRTDSDGKVIESYDRYHPDYEKNLTTEAPVTTESATQKQDKTYYEKAEVEQSSDVIGEETEANAEIQPTTAEAEATADDNGMSTGQIVVLSIIGGLIVIGGGTVGVMAVKKKKK